MNVKIVFALLVVISVAACSGNRRGDSGHGSYNRAGSYGHDDSHGSNYGGYGNSDAAEDAQHRRRGDFNH